MLSPDTEDVASSSVTTKYCLKCETTKPTSEFYGRRTLTGEPGFASWCKKCSNSTRGDYGLSSRRQEYRVVAKVAATEKPSRCPDCGTTNVPSHCMRGRLDAATQEVIWSCLACRNLELHMLRAHKRKTFFCGWCCGRFYAKRARAFCGKKCATLCASAKQNFTALEALHA